MFANFTYNIIGNTCVSASLVRLYGYGNVNPFMWTVLDFDGMYNLISKFDSINFYNATGKGVVVCKKPQGVRPVHYIEIDNTFKLYFPHIIQNNGSDREYRVDMDFAVKNIDHYILLAYIRRLARMRDNGWKPTFLISNRAGFIFDRLSNEQLLKLNNIPSPYCKIFAIDKNDTDSLQLPLSNLIAVEGVFNKDAVIIKNHNSNAVVEPEKSQKQEIKKPDVVIHKPKVDIKIQKKIDLRLQKLRNIQNILKKRK